MAKRLWNFYDGEPFMENPHLGILGSMNPKRRKKGRKHMAKRTARRRRRVVTRARTNRPRRTYRRRARRNSFPMAGIVANPRRRHHRRRRALSNPRRRRHHARRNPSLMGFSLPPLQSVIYAGVGFAGVPIVEGFVSQMVPSIYTSTVGKYGVRIASVIGLSYLTKMVLGGEAAKMVGIGGGAYVVISAIKEFAPGMIPGLSSYVAPNMGAYVGGGSPRQLRAYNQTISTGSMMTTPTRFRRFQ